VIVETIAGVSRARNIGAQEAVGDWLWFLDDDTEPVLDSALATGLDAAKYAGLDFVLANIRSTGAVLAAMPVSRDVKISRRTLRSNFWEPGLLISRSIFLAVKYDETIGIGCLHGSSEGFDLGARLLDHGARGRRLVNYVLDHPELSTSSQSEIERTFFYSMGNASALIKNGFYGLYVYEFARAGKTFLLGLVTGRKAAIRWATVRVLCLALGPLVPRQLPRIMPPPASKMPG
jgi:glycosyltransferase involved in cell wall biosynthesis